jgi:hypothetical protein
MRKKYARFQAKVGNKADYASKPRQGKATSEIERKFSPKWIFSMCAIAASLCMATTTAQHTYRDCDWKSSMITPAKECVGQLRSKGNLQN